MSRADVVNCKFTPADATKCKRVRISPTLAPAQNAPDCDIIRTTTPRFKPSHPTESPKIKKYKFVIELPDKSTLRFETKNDATRVYRWLSHDVVFADSIGYKGMDSLPRQEEWATRIVNRTDSTGMKWSELQFNPRALLKERVHDKPKRAHEPTNEECRKETNPDEFLKDILSSEDGTVMAKHFVRYRKENKDTIYHVPTIPSQSNNLWIQMQERVGGPDSSFKPWPMGRVVHFAKQMVDALLALADLKKKESQYTIHQYCLVQLLPWDIFETDGGWVIASLNFMRTEDAYWPVQRDRVVDYEPYYKFAGEWDQVPSIETNFFNLAIILYQLVFRGLCNMNETKIGFPEEYYVINPTDKWKEDFEAFLTRLLNRRDPAEHSRYVYYSVKNDPFLFHPTDNKEMEHNPVPETPIPLLYIHPR